VPVVVDQEDRMLLIAIAIGCAAAVIGAMLTRGRTYEADGVEALGRLAGAAGLVALGVIAVDEGASVAGAVAIAIGLVLTFDPVGRARTQRTRRAATETHWGVGRPTEADSPGV
jgi:hypothetical protein